MKANSCSRRLLTEIVQSLQNKIIVPSRWSTQAPNVRFTNNPSLPQMSELILKFSLPMKPLKKIPSYLKLVLAALVLTITQPFGVLAQETESEELPAPENRLGLKDRTPEDDAWMKKNFPKTKKIRPNKLALDRVNAERESKGLPHLKESDVDLAPMGEESEVEMSAAPSKQTSSSTTTTTTTTTTEETTQTMMAMPSSADNSLLPAFPPIGQQVLGSCVAWGTTYYQFTHENALVRGWNTKTAGAAYRFSPKWTYNILNGGANNGLSISAYGVLLNHGAANNAEFPEDGDYREWPLNASVWRKALQFRIASKGSISDSNQQNMITQMKQQMANGHVLTFGTFVLSWIQTTVGNDPSTGADDAFVGQKICSHRDTSNQGGHLMTFVGYNDNLWCDINKNGKVDSGEKGAFKVANSWGTGDWNAGFRWVSYDALLANSLVAGAPSNRTTIFQYIPGSATWVTARSNYIPTVLAEFTVNHAKRNQLKMTLGLDDTTKSIPSNQWVPGAVINQGGAYAFNGTTTAVDATFVMDFSDLNPPTDMTKKYFLSISDNVSGSAATLKSFKLTDASGSVLATATDTPKTADASQAWSSVQYNLSSDVNYAPTAVATATPSSGIAPLVVTLNGSGSSDSDGSIASYSWNFGDGTTASGPMVSHTYSNAGTFIATLTVADNEGAKDSATVSIVTSTATIESNNVVQLAIMDPVASESVTDTGKFKISRTGDLSSPLTVNYTMSGKAINGTDYQTLPGSATIQAGAADTEIIVTAINDNLVEGIEGVSMNISSSANYQVGSKDSGTIKLYDDEMPAVNVSATDASASESGDHGVYTFTRTGSTSASLTVAYTMGGGAINGTDYSALSGSVTIPAGAASATVTLTPVNDSLVEGIEAAHIRTSAHASYQVGYDYVATVKILDNN
jgi:hypothetical protein